jgi:ABC-2 type transport system ATP-binding protein/lipopolysaccharide transport system ATP-binding protein
LCKRSLWLDGGRVRDDGDTEQVVRDYLSSGFVPAEGSEAQLSPVGRGPVRLRDVRVTAKGAPDGAALLRDDPLQVVLELEVVEEQLGLDVGVYVTNTRGVRILDQLLSDSVKERLQKGRHCLVLDLPPVLNVGQHTIGVWMGVSWLTFVDEPVAATFELVGSDRDRPERVVVLDLPFRRES